MSEADSDSEYGEGPTFPTQISIDAAEETVKDAPISISVEEKDAENTDDAEEQGVVPKLNLEGAIAHAEMEAAADGADGADGADDGDANQKVPQNARGESEPAQVEFVKGKQAVRKTKSPSIIFLVPYRDREPQLNVFRIMMKNILSEMAESAYEIYFAHQKDSRPFNRGGVLNVGFIAMREKYPETYRDITFVLHDVDTFPCYKNLLNYATIPGYVKHFYGVRNTLGGIVSITGADFEKVNGFPCFWSYGYEDNVLHNRVLKHGLRIDRNNFFAIGNPMIFQSVDDYVKNVNKNWRNMVNHDNGVDGISTIKDIHYEFDADFIDIYRFQPIHRLENERLAAYDLMKNRYVAGGRVIKTIDAAGTSGRPISLSNGGANMPNAQSEQKPVEAPETKPVERAAEESKGSEAVSEKKADDDKSSPTGSINSTTSGASTPTGRRFFGTRILNFDLPKKNKSLEAEKAATASKRPYSTYPRMSFMRGAAR